MKVINYVPLDVAVQAAYSMMPQDQVEYSQLYEEAYYAYESLAVRQVYEERIHLCTVENYTADIPKGVKYIEQVFHTQTESEAETQNVVLYTGDENSISQSYWEFFDADSLRIWQPLRLSNSVWSNAVVCSNSPIIGSLSHHTYTINNRCIITSFENGVICLAGLDYKKDGNGSILIPDEVDVIEAIKYKLLMNFFMKQDLARIEGSSGREQKYRRYWEMYRARAVGDLMLMSIDELENFRNQMNRIGPHNETYNNAFSNLSTGEDIQL